MSLKKNLIYYTCSGEEFSNYALLSIQSLLKNGNFSGTIFIFCDKENEKIFRFQNNKNIFVFPFIGDNYQHMKRIECADFIINLNNFNSFSQIMYLDSDILIQKDINDMFCADDCLMYMEQTIIGDKEIVNEEGIFKKNNIFSTYFYTDDEYEKFKKLPLINNGQYCIDAKLFKYFIEEWKLLMNTATIKEFGIDQSSFNKLIRTNIINSKMWNEEYVYFVKNGFTESEEKKSKAKIIHYLHKTKKQMIVDYEKI